MKSPAKKHKDNPKVLSGSQIEKRPIFCKTSNYTISNPGNYVWVKKKNQLWKIYFDAISATLFVTSLIATLPIIVAIIWFNCPIYILILIWAINIVMAIISDTLKVSIKCPNCGYCPAKSRKTNKVLPSHQINDRLLKLEDCPICWREQ